MKCQVWCTSLMIIVFIFIFTPYSGQDNVEVDYYGHLGGFLGGLFLSGINPTIINQKR